MAGVIRIDTTTHDGAESERTMTIIGMSSITTNSRNTMTMTTTTDLRIVMSVKRIIRTRKAPKRQESTV